MPAASPASIIEMYRRSKAFGCRVIACERSMPPSTSWRTSRMTSASRLSSVCCSRMTRAATTLKPASIIVANWREKTCRERNLTRFRFFGDAPAAPISESEIGRSPFWRRSSRAPFRSGAVTWPSDSAPRALMAL
jgi:hypothetical protein